MLSPAFWQFAVVSQTLRRNLTGDIPVRLLAGCRGTMFRLELSSSLGYSELRGCLVRCAGAWPPWHLALSDCGFSLSICCCVCAICPLGFIVGVSGSYQSRCARLRGNLFGVFNSLGSEVTLPS